MSEKIPQQWSPQWSSWGPETCPKHLDLQRLAGWKCLLAVNHGGFPSPDSLVLVAAIFVGEIHQDMIFCFSAGSHYPGKTEKSQFLPTECQQINTVFAMFLPCFSRFQLQLQLLLSSNVASDPYAVTPGPCCAVATRPRGDVSLRSFTSYTSVYIMYMSVHLRLNVCMNHIYIYNMFRTYIVWFVSDSHVIHIWFFKFLHIFVSNHLRIVGHPMSVFASPWPASLGSELGIEQPVFCSPFESSFRCLWKIPIGFQESHDLHSYSMSWTILWNAMNSNEKYDLLVVTLW